MTPERITELALANGFKLKEQPDGSMALNPYCFDFVAAIRAEPLDMVLHCPKCGLQHIDEPVTNAEWCDGCNPDNCQGGCGKAGKWNNPPHRSHLCAGCNHVWRVADVETNGVFSLKTCGKKDSYLVSGKKWEPTVDTSKVTVDRDALRQVLQALGGHGHEIRELQVTRNLPIGPPNPINTLLDNYNEGP